MKKVAIIGAGPFGLAALRYIKDETDCEVVCYERRGQVGGQWVYDEKTRDEKGNLTTPVYKNLRLNSNKHTSEYPDFHHGSDVPHWPGHKDMAAYFNNYAQTFDLMQNIKLNTKVLNISVNVDDEGEQKFTVVSVDYPKNGTETSTVYDVVVVGNGYYHLPVTPDVPGKAAFSGQMLHSSEYRQPEVYTGHTVLLVGCGLSAWDIAWDLSPHVQKVVLSHYTEDPPLTLPPNGTSALQVTGFVGKTANFEGGQQIEVDTVIFCTGYSPSFPFLDKTCKVEIKDARVKNLYKMIVHTKVPNLFFTGMYYYASFVRLAAIQGQFIASAISGRADLPPPEQMEEEVEAAFRNHLDGGQTAKTFHCLAWNQESYCEHLAKLGKFSAGPKVYWRMMDEILNTIVYKKDLINLRSLLIEPIDDEKFLVTQA